MATDQRIIWLIFVAVILQYVLMYINTSLVPENQESTLIFIKYMHDIVLKISFLDTNSQNWSNGSHLKLLQKSLKIQ